MEQEEKFQFPVEIYYTGGHSIYIGVGGTIEMLALLRHNTQQYSTGCCFDGGTFFLMLLLKSGSI